MADLIIPDVSHWQGKIDWAALRKVTPAVIIKAATDGTPDPQFAYNQAQARANGFEYIGYYQYLNDTANPVLAAQALQRIVGPLKGNENLILDLEEGSGNQAPRLEAWNATIPGDTEVDYSGLSFWKTQLAGAKNAKHRWIAAYRNQEPGEVHTLWQYTDRQPFAGIPGPADASVFHGSVDDLKRSLGLIGTPTPPVQNTPKGLKPGDVGAAVHFWQALLNIVAKYRINSQGKSPGAQLTLESDPTKAGYGPKTREATAEFQRFLNVMLKLKGKPTIPVTGVADPVTISYMPFWVDQAQNGK